MQIRSDLLIGNGGSGMRKWLTWWMVRKIDDKRAPDLIPMGGDPEKIAARDYFTLHMSSDDGNRYLFRGIEQGGLKFSQFNNATGSFDLDVFLSLSETARMELVCTYYYKANEFRFSDRLDFYLSMSSGWWRLQIRRHELSQWIFNRKSLSTTKRLEMMRFICDRKMSDPNFSLNLYSRVMSVYGERVWSHPDIDALAKKEEFLLDSLVETGDLQKTNGPTFKISPKLLASFEALELDERKTSRSNRIQWALWIVGFFAALGACVQAWVAYQGQHPSVPESNVTSHERALEL